MVVATVPSPPMTPRSHSNFQAWSQDGKPAGRKSGIFGQSSFQDGPLAAGLFSEKSGGGTTAAAGSTRGSLSTRVIEMNERRSIGRTRITKGALLFLGMQVGVRSCTIRDVTNVGAGLRAQDIPILPLIFELSFDNFRTARHCRLIWRDGDFLGLAFQN
jgi:hypothetical protein